MLPVRASIFRSVFFAVLIAAGMPAQAQSESLRDKPANTVSADLLRAQLDAISESTDVDDATRQQLTELYREGISNLETANSYNEAIDRFRQAVESAPDEAREARERLEEHRQEDAETSPLPNGMNLGEVDQQLQKEKADLAALEAKLAEFEGQLKAEAERPAAIRLRLTEAQSQKAENESKLGIPPPADMPPQVSQADKWMRETRLEMLRSEILMLDEELLSQPIRLDLLKAQRDLTEHNLKTVKSIVEKLEQIANQARREDAQLAKTEAQAAEQRAAGKHPIIQELAERNAQLGEELDRMADELEGMDAKEQEAAEEAERIETALNTARQKIEIAGLSQVLGQVLYEERRSLPDPRLFNKQARDLEQRIAEVSLAQLQLEEERRELRDPEDYVANLTSQLPPGKQVSDRLMQELGSLVQSRTELVDQGIGIYSAYLRALGELDFAQRRLLDAVETYDAFLDAHLLWVKSSPAVGLESITAIPWQVLRLLSPTGWSDVASTIARRATESPLLLMAVTIFLLLHWKRSALRDALEATGQNVGKITKDRLQDTFLAFLIVVFLALPAPLLMFAIGWELQGAIDASQFTKVIGSALTTIAPIFFELQALRITARPGSVAAVHFGWANDGLERLHHDLKRFIPVVVIGGFVTVAAINEDAEFLGSGLGRLAFVTLMAAFTVFFYRLAHPARGTLGLFFAGNRNSTVMRFRYLWFALLVGPPVAAAIVSLLGFLYTGGTLIDHILKSVWLIVALIIVHQIIVRWLLINRRRLALQAARARLQAAREARAAETQTDDGSERIDLEVREPEVDLTVLDHDSRKLLDSAFSLASLVGIWLIWKEILPAFEILNEVTLWTYTLTTGDTAERIPITLADLGGAVLVVVITVMAVKRLPAFLEIVLLQRLDMTAAGRYTATALTTYTIAAIGIAWTFSVLGGSWSEIQWLVAALGVGIGFGLQEIVANFISGLIILFERPIRVGDVVTVGNVDGVVTKIRIRATTIRDWNRKELLVPNKEFITQQLLNWSLSDQVTRIQIVVGIAYGSDVQRALVLLEEAAREHPRVLEEPPPLVVFEAFGESTLNLSLRYYIESIDYRLATITDLHLAINQKFAEAGIEIAFPQRDVHLDASKPLDIRIHRAPSSG